MGGEYARIEANRSAGGWWQEGVLLMQRMAWSSWIGRRLKVGLTALDGPVTGWAAVLRER